MNGKPQLINKSRDGNREDRFFCEKSPFKADKTIFLGMD